MKILIGQNHLNTIGGSESYTYALAKGFQSLGHTVHIMLGNRNKTGIMSKKIKKDLGITVDKIDSQYDAVFLSHFSSVMRFLNLFPTQPLNNVFRIIHGLVPSQEAPIKVAGLEHIAISEEIKYALEIQHGIESFYVPNFIDTEIFAEVESNPEPKVCLSLAQNDDFNHIVKNACLKLGLVFYKYNKFTNPTLDIAKEIQAADIVVTIGRGCYEAMACGKNVIVADHRPYQAPLADGFLTPSNFEQFHHFNCSGRFSNITPDEDFLCTEMLKYSSEVGSQLRKLAESKLDMGKNCEKLLSLVE